MPRPPRFLRLPNRCVRTRFCIEPLRPTRPSRLSTPESDSEGANFVTVLQPRINANANGRSDSNAPVQPLIRVDLRPFAVRFPSILPVGTDVRRLASPRGSLSLLTSAPTVQSKSPDVSGLNEEVGEVGPVVNAGAPVGNTRLPVPFNRHRRVERNRVAASAPGESRLDRDHVPGAAIAVAAAHQIMHGNPLHSTA